RCTNRLSRHAHSYHHHHHHHRQHHRASPHTKYTASFDAPAHQAPLPDHHRFP
ncbi:hypothetical protein CH063_16172, partial [Colletotrichum higginsianum]